MFGDLVHDPKTSISRHPEDYRLYQVGSFNQGAGTFSAMVTPGFLASAVEFLTPGPAKREAKTDAVLA